MFIFINSSKLYVLNIQNGIMLCNVIHYFQKQFLSPFKSLLNGYIIFYQLKNVLTESANPFVISRLSSLKSFIYLLIHMHVF